MQMEIVHSSAAILEYLLLEEYSLVLPTTEILRKIFKNRLQHNPQSALDKIKGNECFFEARFKNESRGLAECRAELKIRAQAINSLAITIAREATMYRRRTEEGVAAFIGPLMPMPMSGFSRSVTQIPPHPPLLESWRNAIAPQHPEAR